MSFTLKNLPYEQDALEPHISKKTLSYHYGKHHAGYVKKLNAGVEGKDYASMALEEVIRESKKRSDQGIFNNAAQVLNHDQYWESMSPTPTGAPSGELAKAIDRDFGSLDKLTEKLKSAATGLFGSGWVWLVSDDGKLDIRATSNAETPLTDGLDILLTVDVWEHAYYLDFQNDRPSYVDLFFDTLVNWTRAGQLYKASLSRKAA